MKLSIIKTQKGIGLIEVLIATVVVAVGLLAVASLQGKFMSSSGGSKTRAEAQLLAEQKLEALRNNVTITGYRDLNADGVVDAATITATDSPVGTNASFTRTWTITDVAPPVPPFTAADPKLRKISVQVGWDANGDGTITPPDETVNVVTEMAWIDPAKAAEYAAANAGGSTSVASPRQNASEDVAAEKVIGGTALTIPSGVTAGTATSINVTVPATATSSGGSVTIYQVGPGSHYYTLTDSTFVSPGVIAVFLCTTTCTHIQNHFGGVVHRIAGTVHSTSSNGFTNIKVAWTSSSVNDCYNGDITVVSGSGSDQYRYRPYECIYAGNCNATADGVNGCFPDSVVSDDQINARKVGPGGEYGDVGLLGVDDQGGDREQVCLLEDTVDPATSPLLAVSGSAVLNENYLYSVTKRFYAARRIKRNTATSINDQKTEGINHSYTNHNFLVISRGTGATANQLCNLKATAKFIRLAPREIFKTLDQSASNTVLAITDFVGAAGTAKTLTGTVTSDATKLKLIIPDVGNCYLNNNTNAISAATAYACAVPNGMASVDIKGGSNEYPTITPNAVFATCTKTDATTCNWRGNFTQVATQSNDCTAPWGAAVISGSGVTAYQNEIEPFGGTCMPQTRTCSGTPGVLSGTYTNQACTVAASADCASPFAGGATITNGGSVNAYSIASVPFGFTCPAFVVRTCTNGILSGSGTFATCTVQSTRDITVTATQTGTGTVSGITVTGTGATCAGLTCTVDNAWTGTLTATGTCSGGGTVTGTSASIIASATSATITLGSCTGPVCTTPWNATVASGGSTTAYLASSVLSPSTCTSELRFCNDGVLAGTYTNQSCSVIPTYAITVAAANSSGSVSSSTCNGGSCSGLVAGTYTVAVTLSGGDACSKPYTITGNTTVTVTKGTGQGAVCSMAP
jgi:type IV pilus modification protein PilV